MLARKLRGAEARPPSFVGYVTATVNDEVSTSISVDLSSLDSGGPIGGGDLCIIHAVQDFNTFDGIDNGFECVNQTRYTSPIHHVYAKELSGSETTVTVSAGSTVGYALLIAVVYRNAEIRQTIQYLPATATITSCVFPAPRCAGGRSIVHICGAVDDDIVTDFAAPSGYTLQVTETVGVSGIGCSAAIATKFDVPAGIESPGDITGTFSDNVKNMAIELVPKGTNASIVSGLTGRQGSGTISFVEDLPKSGDLILVTDSNNGGWAANVSAPATLTGYTSILTDADRILPFNVSYGYRLQYKIADGTETGVTLNGDEGAYWVFRDFNGETLGVGSSASQVTNEIDISCPTPAISSLDTGGTSYVLTSMYKGDGFVYSDDNTAYPETIMALGNGVAGNTSSSISADTLDYFEAVLNVSFAVEITVT